MLSLLNTWVFKRQALEASLGLLLLLYAIWLAQFPVFYPSDDALFFVRGVTAFSLLELSPHFPGYPGFIMLARGLQVFVGDALMSVYYLSLSFSVLLPWLVFRLLRPKSLVAAVLGALLIVSSGLVAGLGSAVLSDGVGLALFLMHCLALQKQHAKSAGAMAALVLSVRPAYLILVVLTWVYVGCCQRDLFKAYTAVLAVGGLLALGLLFALEGPTLWPEALRFTVGHFTVWGHTALGSGDVNTWWSTYWAWLGPFAGGSMLLLLVAVGVTWRWQDWQALPVWLLLGYVLWIGLAQNADNVRHLFPVLIFACLVVLPSLARWPASVRVSSACLILGVCVALLLRNHTFIQQPSPLGQVSAFLAQQPPVRLVTHHGVAVLRHTHPDIGVVDAHYQQSSQFWLRTSGTLKLTSQPVQQGLIQAFPQRWPGEKTLYLHSPCVFCSQLY